MTTELQVIEGEGFPENLKRQLVEEAAYALMKRWFPNRLPTGDDYLKWVEISVADSTAVVEHFIDSGILAEEKK
jgi:hypothetical protein